jgi:acyl-CoA dehydrogenase
MWDFSTESEFQTKLDWMTRFVKEEVEPLDLVFTDFWSPYDMANKAARAAIRPLRQEVKRQGLWACHLGPELGGHGYGQIKLALMNEILGRTIWGPTVFGTAAPDTGNAEILAMFGTEEQKERYLKPLLEGDIVSCFSMTEPQGGADPKTFRTKALRDGDHWIINGEKWFSSNARFASFLIVMAITDPKVSAYKGMSMFLIPADTPGVNILRNVGTLGDIVGRGSHAYIRYENVRVPHNAILGGEGQAFVVAQARLGGGRIHHAMRSVGQCGKALDMMCERALSRHTQGTSLAEKQLVQSYIADSWIELRQFRLLVMHAAWTIDQGDQEEARTAIAAVKAATPKVLHDIVHRAIQVHGSLGVSNEMPLGTMWMRLIHQGVVDGPTEVHKVTVAKRVLKDYAPAPGLFPTAHLIDRVAAARAKFAEYLELDVASRF